MLQTANRIEASTEATTAATAPLPSCESDVPPNRSAWSRRLGRALVGCLVAEAAVGAIALAVLGGALAASESDLETTFDGVAESPPALPAADDTETFLAAWARSLEHDHRVTGTLTRSVLGRDALLSSNWPDPAVGVDGSTAAVWIYRHGRSGGRALTQIGDVATVVDPIEGRRTCLRQSSGFVCTDDAGPTDDAMAVVEQAVVGPDATHRIVAIDSIEVLNDFPGIPTDISCWEARSLTDGVDQRWGRRAQFCFHGPTGAAVFRRMLGTTRLEVLIADSVSETVLPADLDPA